MAWDDPVVWVLIIAVVIFLFGANKVPQLAKGLGQARREFERASKGLTDPESVINPTSVQPANPASTLPSVSQEKASASTVDPLLAAAQNEGIETRGKTREQIASELAWKLKK
ncbi:MAG: twin-arginine translocase TatA/TatE family subunit [Thaumarchaeota archaeon]|nr:twin-arginine translocase TatA/TatE family subunit [Nitrososphaerota archaeon]